MLKKEIKYLFLLLILLGEYTYLIAQKEIEKDVVLLQTIDKDAYAVKYAEQSITQSELKKLVYKLASDEFEGRETGEKGQESAAEFIADYFKQEGIPPYNGTYFQKFELIQEYPADVIITAGGKEFKFMSDFYFFGGFGDTIITHDKIVFAGYGIDDAIYSDYTDKKAIDGKIIMVLSGEPKDRKGNYLITGSEATSEWTSNWKKKASAAKKNGAAALLIVSDKFEENKKKYEHQINKPMTRLSGGEPQPAGMPVMYISPAMGDYLLSSARASLVPIKERLEKSGSSVTIDAPQSITLNITRKKEIKSGENIIGYIEGNELKEELIVITAHYDHLGIVDGKIYYGADDNASGTSGIMTIATAFSKARENGITPKRSILVMPVSGEEKGLYGSLYYVENPIFPLERTIANLNVDMIGRIDDNYKEDPDYVYLIGSDKISTDLHLLSENVNSTYSNLKLDYKYNAEDDPNRFYYRSDHYNFAKKEIPVIFYFNGMHEDYHEPTDTPDKIHFGKVEKISRLIFYTAWELANRQEELVKDKLKEN